MDEQFEFIMKKHGINLSQNPSPDQLDEILRATANDSRITQDMFINFFNSFKIDAIVVAFTKINTNQTFISQDTLKIIQSVTDTLLELLKDKDLTEDERKEIYKLIFKCIDDARKESEDQRNFNLENEKNISSTIGKVLLGSGAVLAGVALLIASKGRNSEVLQKGVEYIVKK